MRILSTLLWRNARTVRRDFCLSCALVFVATRLSFLAWTPEELGLGRFHLFLNAFGCMAITVLSVGLSLLYRDRSEADKAMTQRTPCPAWMPPLANTASFLGICALSLVLGFCSIAAILLALGYQPWLSSDFGEDLETALTVVGSLAAIMAALSRYERNALSCLWWTLGTGLAFVLIVKTQVRLGLHGGDLTHHWTSRFEPYQLGVQIMLASSLAVWALSLALRPHQTRSRRILRNGIRTGICAALGAFAILPVWSEQEAQRFWPGRKGFGISSALMPRMADAC